MPQRPPSSADSTSGYFSSGASYVDDQAGKFMEIFPCFICLHQFPMEDIRNIFLLTCGLLGYDNMQYGRWVSSLECSALKTEAIYSSEMLVPNYHITTYHNSCYLHHMRTSDHTYVCLLNLIIKGELFQPDKIDYNFLLNNAQIKEKIYI